MNGYAGPRKYDESRWRRGTALEIESTKCQYCGETARLGSPYLSTIDGETTVRRIGTCTRKVKRREPKCPPTILSEGDSMPRATEEQKSKITELVNRGVSKSEICRRAGMHMATITDFLGKNGIGADRIGNLMATVDHLLSAAPPIENLINTAPMPGTSEVDEGLEWTTNGLKVWTDESGLFDSKVDFWSIGREVEALWLEAESKLKLLSPDESEILRTTIKRRISA